MTARIYYAVPTNYTIGTEFETFGDAEQHARSLLRLLDWGDYTRQFVDERERDEHGSDRVVRRWEVYHDRTNRLMSEDLDNEVAKAIAAYDSETAKTIAAYKKDATVTNEEYGLLVEVAAEADERRSWKAEREDVR